MSETTLYDRIINSAKNHPIIAVIGVLVALTLTISQFTESISKLSSSFTNEELLVAEITVHDELIEPLVESVSASPQLGASTPSLLVPPILDIKLVNNSRKAVFIKNINLTSLKVSYEPPNAVCMGAFFVPSGYYDISIDLDSDSDSSELHVSHTVKKGEFERFLVSIAPDERSSGRAVFQISVELVGIGEVSIPLDPVNVTLVRTPGTCDLSDTLRSRYIKIQ